MPAVAARGASSAGAAARGSLTSSYLLPIYDTLLDLNTVTKSLLY